MADAQRIAAEMHSDTRDLLLQCAPNWFVAADLRWSRAIGATGSALMRLSGRGLLQRATDDVDRRRSRYRLTPLGLEVRTILVALTERKAPAESTPSPDTEGVRLAVRPEVAAFALLMERELRANDHKPGWKNDTPTALADRARDEVAELREVVGQLDRQIIWAPYPDARANGWHRKNPDTGLREVGVGYVPAEGSLRAELEQRAASEAADVANMAMMVADVCGALKSSPPVSTVDEEGGGA